MRRDDQRLNDILKALDWVRARISGRTEKDFLDDEVLSFAVAQNLVIVGEAAARISPALKAKYPAIPWVDITGMRNFIIHEYFGVHWPLVWRTVVNRAPEFRAQIAAIVEAEQTAR
jgi:uncharacterized protein with HEPN domain